MLGIPVHTLYRWRHKGDGPVGYRVGRHVRYRREAVEASLEHKSISAGRPARISRGGP
jgi:excisionase family DNA binding protein